MESLLLRNDWCVLLFGDLLVLVKIVIRMEKGDDHPSLISVVDTKDNSLSSSKITAIDMEEGKEEEE